MRYLVYVVALLGMLAGDGAILAAMWKVVPLAGFYLAGFMLPLLSSFFIVSLMNGDQIIMRTAGAP